MSNTVRAALLAGAFLASPVAMGQAGTFVVSNDSDFAVVGFQTGEGGHWSNDWIPGDAIMPGEQFQMQFTSSAGACVVPTRVMFEDGNSFEVDVDYCSTAHLVLTNTAISGA
jgi:hypothetical protein